MNKAERLARVKRTGEHFIVQQRDVFRRIVFTHGPVVSYKGEVVRYDGSRSFRDDEVEVTDISTLDVTILKALFEETRKSPAFKPRIMRGDLEVKAKKDGSEARFVKAPKSSHAHEVFRCPCHSERMRLRRGPKGGLFWGCPTRSETGCNITFSQDGTMSDPDGQFKDAAE